MVSKVERTISGRLLTLETGKMAKQADGAVLVTYGESVVLDMSSGKYYGLNSVGSAIWNLIQQPRTIRDLRDALVAEFEVDPQRCEEDLLAWLESMSDKELVKVVEGTQEDAARS